MSIRKKNTEFNLKLDQVKSNLKVLEKEKRNLAKVQAAGTKTKAMVERLTEQAKREGKLDEIIDRQEVIIQKLQSGLEKALMAKGKVSDNHVERESLTKEITELKSEI